MAKGIKTGGRKKGTKNKPRVNPTVVEEAIVASVASGLTPLEYMLDVMRDRTQEYARRDEMAKAAAPYATKSADTLKAEVIALIADLGLAPMIPTGIANRTNGKDGTKH